jgi:RecJ-like exonuclease
VVLVCFDIEFEMEQQVRVDNLAPLVVEVDEVCILEAVVVAS